ncbi:MAG: metallophosphoesterase [Phycisphaeraceae bacterium]
MDPLVCDRRTFLRRGSCFLFAAGAGVVSPQALRAAEAKPLVRFGMVTDMHYADKQTRGSRHYRKTLEKLEAAAAQFKKAKPAFVVELGDFIDRAPEVEVELAYLERIHKDFSKLPGDKHYVLGNHCIDTLTKEEFLGVVGQEKSYYSFDEGGVHFVVLDACFLKDGTPYGRNNSRWNDANFPQEELDWLVEDLKQTKHKSIVFLHQRLDVDNGYAVNNAAAARKIMEDAGNVLAVFQGHSHKNDHKIINGIHYCVHRAMVEGGGEKDNGFSTLEVLQGGTIKLTGFFDQKDYEWKA